VRPLRTLSKLVDEVTLHLTKTCCRHSTPVGYLYARLHASKTIRRACYQARRRSSFCPAERCAIFGFVPRERLQPLSTFARRVTCGEAKRATKDARYILIVEDDDAPARCLERIASDFGATAVEATVSGALHQVTEQLYGTLPWLDLVWGARATDSGVPALVLTAYNDHDVNNVAVDLRAQYLAKPATRTQNERFPASATERSLTNEHSASE
jgi:CheY-like chemotaxis protein